MSFPIAYAMKQKAKKMAKGGFTEEEEDSGYEPMPATLEQPNEGAEIEDADMISRIMKHRRMSQGGMVANDTPVTADFEDNQFDDLAKEDDLEFSDTGANSGDELGDEQEDEDRKDVVGRIMRSRSKKDRLPRPA